MESFKISTKYGDYPRLDGVDLVVFLDSSSASTDFLRLRWKRSVSEESLVRAVEKIFALEGSKVVIPSKWETANFRLEGSLRTLRSRVKNAKFTFWKGPGCELAEVTVPLHYRPFTETGHRMVEQQKAFRK